VSDFDRGWLVGIIEGEGSIFLGRKKDEPPRYPTVQVKMTDEDTILRVQKVARCGRVFGPHSPPSAAIDCRLTGGKTERRPTWTWRVKGEDAWSLLERLFEDFSARRRAQAIIVLEAPRYA
jgi:hypothetical protein